MVPSAYLSENQVPIVNSTGGRRVVLTGDQLERVTLIGKFPCGVAAAMRGSTDSMTFSAA